MRFVALVLMLGGLVLMLAPSLGAPATLFGIDGLRTTKAGWIAALLGMAAQAAAMRRG